MINAIIPRMQESLLCNPVKPVYGMALEEHLRCTNRDIAQVIEACVCYLLECGIEEEVYISLALGKQGLMHVQKMIAEANHR
ncbi:hypothetical protein DPMN_034388 [Dreissena polymorpha]|uniref:Uncharacterized protein n=1 Tax=Dreissena polymorpha TaxID=45954 RepID=A0A9D4M8J3_DREPO|nr:hypothetical protein DPMN_034388 [Dreissena polymorpha]